MQDSLNPYAAPPDVTVSHADRTGELPREITLTVTDQRQRYAEKHYLLHWHSGRLTVLSILAIAGGSTLNIWLQSKSIAPLLITQTILGLVTAAIYLLVVRRSKSKTRGKIASYGMRPGERCTLRIDRDNRQVSLTTPKGSFQWNAAQIDLCQTLGGLMICPEPHLYIFVPKSTDLLTCNRREFRKQLARLIEKDRQKRGVAVPQPG